MSTVQTTPMTADEFWEWCSRPENRDGLYELARGEVVEMPSPGEQHGSLCMWIGYRLMNYVVQRGSGGVCANDTGLLVERGPDTVRGPDLMLFDESRPLDQLSRKYSTRIPRLVVEVLSPTDRWSRIALRVGQYLARGVSIVWVVDPEERTVTIHRPNELPQVREEQHELTGNGVLENFSLKVADLFNLPGSAPPSGG